MGNARQIFHEHSVLFPAFLHHFTTGIKHDDVGEGLGPSALRTDGPATPAGSSR